MKISEKLLDRITLTMISVLIWLMGAAFVLLLITAYVTFYGEPLWLQNITAREDLGGRWYMAIGGNSANKTNSIGAVITVDLRPVNWGFAEGGGTQTETWKEFHEVRVRFKRTPSNSGRVLGGRYEVVIDDPRITNVE